MIIVDKEIKELVNKQNLITNFNERQLSSISYDVVIDKFILENEEIDNNEYILSSSQFIYVKTKESLNMPYNLCCKIIEKNSLMRSGLKVDGPLYQPGHKTSIFLRVVNISKSDILLKKNMKIAQLVFMKLNELPNNTYDKQENARYNNEENFIH